MKVERLIRQTRSQKYRRTATRSTSYTVVRYYYRDIQSDSKKICVNGVKIFRRVTRLFTNFLPKQNQIKHTHTLAQEFLVQSISSLILSKKMDYQIIIIIIIKPFIICEILLGKLEK